MAAREDPVLLDCTIRDGSYAIDFKFTAADTALLAGLLEQAGLRWIEVGHGLGLGASEAGKGLAASSDLEVIERTRSRVSDAAIGAFFIPGVGTDDDLRAARAAGLDFVRVGQNADELESAWASVELARELGFDVFVNLMKTYGVSPAAFADAALRAERHGARGVYVVDSAGGMMPAEVAGYIEAARAAGARLELGFHGHSNLHLAVANSLAAHEAGARFIDTSVYGIGRSSGNVPTEVMAAVFDRLGVDCGVDAREVIDLAESWLRPLAEHLHPHDMLAVSLGYGRFHSSFLPRALAAAEKAGVNPFRVVVEAGRRDPMRLPDALLDEVVADVRGAGLPARREDLAEFADASFGPASIRTGTAALAELLDGLEVVAAKRRLEVVLELVHSPALDEEALSVEFVLEDEEMALGRLRFGALDVAAEALAAHAGRIGLAVLDAGSLEAGSRGESIAALRSALGPGKVALESSSALALEQLAESALAVAAAQPVDRVLLGADGLPPQDRAALSARLGAAAPVEPLAGADPGAGDLVVAAGPLGEEAAAPPATVVRFRAGDDPEEPGPGTLLVAREDGYRRRLPRWRLAAAAATHATARVGA